MECYKKIGLLLCGTMMMLQSCVTNNLDDCPDSIRYAIAFEYTLHTGENDRFYDDVDKMYVYVFDAVTRVCVYADTATLLAPFVSDFVYPLPLDAGNYDIIAWGWGRNPGDRALKMSTAVIPTVVVGLTSIDDARLQLEEATCSGQLERIFYSEHRNVEVSAFVSRVDTLPLMNITNQIRIVLPDVKTAGMQDKMTISIVGNDGAYYFNSVSRSPDNGEGYFKSGNNAPDIDGGRGAVTYLPYVIYRTDSILLADPIYMTDPYTGTGLDSMMIVEISSLRLVQNNANMKVILNYNDGEVIKELPLLELLQTGMSGRIQTNLDTYSRWQLEHYMFNTHLTVHIYAMDWHVIYRETGMGGILQ